MSWRSSQNRHNVPVTEGSDAWGLSALYGYWSSAVSWVPVTSQAGFWVRETLESSLAQALLHRALNYSMGTNYYCSHFIGEKTDEKYLRPHNWKAEEWVFQTGSPALQTSVLCCLLSSQPRDPASWHSALRLSGNLGNNFEAGVSSLITAVRGGHENWALIKLGPCCGITFYIHHKANKLIN